MHSVCVWWSLLLHPITGGGRGSVACICSALKSSLYCQNFFFGIFSISGSLKPCICFPLVASVNTMSFFIIIFKYYILNEKMHSFNGLINWCYLLSLPHLLFTHFPSFSLWFISLSQLCSCIHGLLCFHVCGTAHGTSQWKPKWTAMDSARSPVCWEQDTGATRDKMVKRARCG